MTTICSGDSSLRVVVSAPGKVLVTGAYLVLEKPNSGLVISTSARFFAVVDFIDEDDLQRGGDLKVAEAACGEDNVQVRVLSPQLERVSRYSLQLSSCQLTLLHSDDKISEGNPYVEYAIQCAVAFASEQRHDHENLRQQLRRGLKVTILGDNDFYSHRDNIKAADGLEVVSASLHGLSRFAPVTRTVVARSAKASGNVVPPEIRKTGLGSSAAMVTAVVGSILQMLQVIDLTRGKSVSDRKEEKAFEVDSVFVASDKVEGREDMNRKREGVKIDTDPSYPRSTPNSLDDHECLRVIHVLAQIAHCAAQGKVGSGFDVSAAVYGTQRYTRFSPSVLTPLSTGVDGGPLGPVELVSNVMQASWDEERKPFTLPPGLELMLGEIGAGGSSTPSMVGAIQRWRKQQPDEARRIWMSLAKANEDVENGLRQLFNVASQNFAAYSCALAKCSILSATEWLELTDSELSSSDKLASVQSLASCGSAGERVAALLWATRAAFERVRAFLKEMGENAGVPIEPCEQTKLLDTTIRINGVLMAGVPGAGGYDAVFAIVIGKDARHRVEEEWRRTTGRVIALPTKQASSGVQMESGFSASNMN